MSKKTRDHQNGVEKFDHYSIREIKVGHKVQLTRLRNSGTKSGTSLSIHYEVERIDPTGSGKIFGKEYIPVGSKETGIFHVSQIYRNYSIDPICPTADSYKKKPVEFTRTPLF